MKRNKLTITLLLFLLVIFISSCGNKENQNNITNNNSSTPINTLILGQDQTLSPKQCLERNLNNKIIVFESTYCPHCAKVKLILEEIEQEREIEIIFLNLDKDSGKVASYKILPRYTPTVLIDCQVIIGGRDKEFYESLIK